MADIDDLDHKLKLVLLHLEHIEKHLNIPPLTVQKSAPKRTSNVLPAGSAKMV